MLWPWCLLVAVVASQWAPSLGEAVRADGPVNEWRIGGVSFDSAGFPHTKPEVWLGAAGGVVDLAMSVVCDGGLLDEVDHAGEFELPISCTGFVDLMRRG